MSGNPIRVLFAGTLCALGLTAFAPAAGADVSINIADGATTFDWPSVGSMDSSFGSCTGILVGCRTVLTSAHCVCDGAGPGPACGASGTFQVDPADVLVFFQHNGDQDPFSTSLGQIPVESIEVPPNYQFGVTSDVALLKLVFPVRGVAPAPLNEMASPSLGTSGTIAGFGSTSFNGADEGIKREATVTTGSCTGSGAQASTHVCWTASPEVTCMGDSGGPLLADLGAGMSVAGVHSGSSPEFCEPASIAFDADVFVDNSWILSTGGADLDVSACGDGPQVGDVQVTSDGFSGVVTDDQTHSFSVAAGTKVLRVALNAELAAAPRTCSNDPLTFCMDDLDCVNPGTCEPPLNDFDLLVGTVFPVNPGNATCYPALLGSVEYCEIPDPVSGTWHAKVEVFAGGPSEYQVTATQLPENPAPPGLGAGDLLVADFISWELMQVDASGGDRSIRSSQLRGTGEMLAGPEDVAVAADGTIVVTNLADRSVFTIALGTGDRTVLSGCTDFPCGTLVGSGPEFLGPRFVGFEANDDLVITDRLDPGIAAVVRVDAGNGNRSIVSGCDDLACSSETGTGPSLDTPFGIVVDAGDDLVVADSFGLVSIDPTNGNRTLLSGGGAGSGENFRQPRDLGIEAGGDFLVVDGDPIAPAVFHVDAGTGDRTVVSGCADAACNVEIGTGPSFGTGLIGLAIEVGGDLIVTDTEQASVFRVDRSNGNRTLLSGCDDASCGSVAGSGTHLTAPAGIALPEPDVWLGLLAGIGLLGALRRLRRA